MKQTAGNLREVLNMVVPVLRKIDESRASTKPAPNKWSPKEIIGHLIDSANNNQMKFVRLIETNTIDVAGYHQDEWVGIQKYQLSDWNFLIDFWQYFNLHIAHIIEHTPESALGNELKVEGVGPFKLEFIMKDYVEHLKHHLNQAVPELALKSNFKMVY